LSVVADVSVTADISIINLRDAVQTVGAAASQTKGPRGSMFRLTSFTPSTLVRTAITS
jgi:hypothetical protein